MILMRYLISSISRSTLLVGAALVGLFSFIDMMYELDAFGSMQQAFIYVALRLPVQMYQLLPISMMLGSLFALSTLVRDSEYPVIRMAGVSLSQLASMLIRVGLLFALLTFLIGELAVPFSDNLTKRYRAEATAKMGTTAIANNLWMKDQNTFISVGELGADQVVHKLQLFELNEQGQIHTISSAGEARYAGNGQWSLQNIRQIRLVAGHVQTSMIPTAVWHSRLTPELVRVLVSTPDKMSSWQLYQFVQHLAANHQDTRRYETALWGKLGYPFTCLALVLLSLPFAQYQKRSGNAGGRLIAGVLLGLLFFVTNQLVAHLSILYGFSPILTAIAPTTTLLLLAVGVLWWQEYGRIRFGS